MTILCMPSSNSLSRSSACSCPCCSMRRKLRPINSHKQFRSSSKCFKVMAKRLRRSKSRTCRSCYVSGLHYLRDAAPGSEVVFAFLQWLTEALAAAINQGAVCLVAFHYNKQKTQPHPSENRKQSTHPQCLGSSPLIMTCATLPST